MPPILRAARRLPLLRVLFPPPAPVVADPASLDTRRAAWARALKQLLPPSTVLWTLTPGSTMTLALEALATELARIEGRGLDLLEEADPRTTTELLPDWERMLGLPDGCVVELLETTAERRLVITEKYTARGGQSPAYFIGQAAKLGVIATVNEFHSLVLRAGFRAGERCYGEEWSHVWELDASDRLPAPRIRRVECINTADGSLPPGRYYYRIVARNAIGATLGSLERSGVAPAGTSTNIMEVEWEHVEGAESYDVYGRDRRGELYMVSVSEVDAAVDGHKFQDDGSISPGGTPLPETNTTGSGAPNGVELPAPMITTVEWASDSDGALGPGTWYYVVTAMDDVGETLASAEGFGVAGGATTTNRMRVHWTVVPGATNYRVYGRDTGAEGYMVDVSAEDAGLDPLFDDEGSSIPGAAPPSSNTTRTDIARTLECRVRKASPAHSLVLFAYP